MRQLMRVSVVAIIISGQPVVLTISNVIRMAGTVSAVNGSASRLVSRKCFGMVPKYAQANGAVVI